LPFAFPLAGDFEVGGGSVEAFRTSSTTSCHQCSAGALSSPSSRWRVFVNCGSWCHASQFERVLHVPTITLLSGLSAGRRSCPPTQPDAFLAADKRVRMAASQSRPVPSRRCTCVTIVIIGDSPYPPLPQCWGIGGSSEERFGWFGRATSAVHRASHIRGDERSPTPGSSQCPDASHGSPGGRFRPQPLPGALSRAPATQVLAHPKRLHEASLSPRPAVLATISRSSSRTDIVSQRPLSPPVTAASSALAATTHAARDQPRSRPPSSAEPGPPASAGAC
jgi:hypothetical protein